MTISEEKQQEIVRLEKAVAEAEPGSSDHELLSHCMKVMKGITIKIDLDLEEVR